jgi:hypothetical protein
MADFSPHTKKAPSVSRGPKSLRFKSSRDRTRTCDPLINSQRTRVARPQRLNSGPLRPIFRVLPE